MSDANVLRAALRELLDNCKNEIEVARRDSTAPPEFSVDEYLSTAEQALAQLAETVDEEQCTALARQILGAVARVRSCYGRLGVNSVSTTESSDLSEFGSATTDIEKDITLRDDTDSASTGAGLTD